MDRKNGWGAAALMVALAAAGCAPLVRWPRWRGPNGNAVSDEAPLPVTWTPSKNVVWKAAVPGEGSSSPVVWGDSVFVTSALEDGARRVVSCLALGTGRTR